MSGLRDALGRWAADRGDEVAAAASVRERETRGAIALRRRRSLALTAAVAVIAVAGAAALVTHVPGGTARPAQPAPSGMVLSDVTTLACGEPWLLAAGETTYVSDPGSYFQGASGDWSLLGDDGNVAPAGTFDISSSALRWQGNVEIRGQVVVRAAAVAVADGEIVGSRQGASYRSFVAGGPASEFAALPGQCGDEVRPQHDGAYTFHLVLQVSQVSDGERLVATVVDPSGPLTVEVSGVTDWSSTNPATPASPAAPQGDHYQAFVVQAPVDRGACRPYQDLRALGQPAASSGLYQVTIPGVQPLTNGMWARDPVVVTDEDLSDAWYVGKRAWLVADDVGIMAEPHLGWTRSPWRLADAPVAGNATGPDCFFVDRLDPVKGAVWLVIDGVDPAVIDMSIDPTFDASTLQTWVYLGQAR